MRGSTDSRRLGSSPSRVRCVRRCRWPWRRRWFGHPREERHDDDACAQHRVDSRHQVDRRRRTRRHPLRRRQGRQSRRADARRPAGAARLRRRRARRTRRSVEQTGLRGRIESRAWRTWTSTTDRARGGGARRPQRMVDAAIRARSGWPRRSGSPTPSWWARDCGRRRSPSAPRRRPRTRESASFAGMNETFLNIRGADAVARRRSAAAGSSLFGARTIFYRAQRGFGQADMDIAVVVQRQIASTRAGVMFTVDPATGAHGPARDRGLVRARRGGRLGRVSPDRYVVDKETLAIVAREVRAKELVIEPRPQGGTTVRELSAEERLPPDAERRRGMRARPVRPADREHYGSPQDTEWAFDADGEIWMLQSRPVTTTATPASEGHEGATLLRGLGAAPGVAAGPVRILASLDEAGTFLDGATLVTRMTAPDWVPLMRRASAIVTDSGGMTCHAAIVSRELGIPCVVGTQHATTQAARRGARDRRRHPRRGARGRAQRAGAGAEGRAGRWQPRPPPPPRACCVNLSEPSQVAGAATLDVDGVGLLRAELMVLEALDGRHPRLLHRAGRRRRVRRPDDRRADDVRRRLRAAADHLPHDRLPHERVPRTSRAASGSSRRRPTR